MHLSICRLSGRRPVIDSDVEGGRAVACLDDVPRLPEKVPQVAQFFLGEIEDTGDVASRDDQRMARGDWVAVPDGQASLIFRQDPFSRRRTEHAASHGPGYTPENLGKAMISDSEWPGGRAKGDSPQRALRTRSGIFLRRFSGGDVIYICI
jgi:hypothetical protein